MSKAVKEKYLKFVEMRVEYAAFLMKGEPYVGFDDYALGSWQLENEPNACQCQTTYRRI